MWTNSLGHDCTFAPHPISNPNAQFFRATFIRISALGHQIIPWLCTEAEPLTCFSMLRLQIPEYFAHPACYATVNSLVGCKPSWHLEPIRGLARYTDTRTT